MVILYMVLATAMFYFVRGEIGIGGFNFMYQYLFGIAIVLLGAGFFFVRPQPERARFLIKYSFVLGISYYIPLLSSFIIWITSLAKFRTITSGFFMIMYIFLGIGVAAATLYMFGKKGIWYCLGSLIIANILRALLIIQNAELGQFLIEFKELILSFANRTGSLIGKMEVHDQNFAVGIFLIFLLVCKKKIKYNFCWLFLTLLCFLMGLKRIAMIGGLVALIAIAFLRLFKGKAVQRGALFISYIAIGVSFLYIIAIHEGLFDFLEKTLHINTMFRKTLYEEFAKYYEISITYMGKGAGFCNTNWLNFRGISSVAPHNDFLRMYAEIGFVGYFIWAWAHFVFRVKYFFEENENTGLLLLALSIYSYINYMTDNTLYYFYTTIAFSISVMAYCMNDMKLFESIE